MSLPSTVFCWLVVIICVALGIAAHRNARFCLLNQHEDFYATALIVAALTIAALLIK